MSALLYLFYVIWIQYGDLIRWYQWYCNLRRLKAAWTIEILRQFFFMAMYWSPWQDYTLSNHCTLELEWEGALWEVVPTVLHRFSMSGTAFPALDCRWRCWAQMLSNKTDIWLFAFYKANISVVIIIILAVHATAGRWPPQLAPCTSILGRSHPLTANGFLDVISPSPFGSSS